MREDDTWYILRLAQHKCTISIKDIWRVSKENVEEMGRKGKELNG